MTTNRLSQFVQRIPYEIPPLPPLAIRPLMRPGSVTLLVGSPGVGKTTLLAELCYATALSHLKTYPVPCWGGLLSADADHLTGYRVAILDNETNPEGWTRTIKAHTRARGEEWKSPVTRTAIDGLLRIPAGLTYLSDPKRREQGVQEVVDVLLAWDVGMVVIDPISDVFGLRQVGEPDWVVDGLRPLVSQLQRHKILTVLSAHTARGGAGKQPLGTSQQEGCADIQLSISEKTSENLQTGVELELVKYRADGRYWIKKGSRATLEFGNGGGGYYLSSDPQWPTDPPTASHLWAGSTLPQ